MEKKMLPKFTNEQLLETSREVLELLNAKGYQRPISAFIDGREDAPFLMQVTIENRKLTKKK